MDNYDVIVVGLGTAGSIAAITASRFGLSVLGIERTLKMGGTATSGAVLGYYYGASGGVFEEIDEQCYKAKGFIPVNHIYPDHIHSDNKALALENEALKSGVEIAYDAWVVKVIKQKHAVVLEWMEDNGRHSASAKYVIDATGEAEICAMAGAQLKRGRTLDHETQPYSISTLTLENGSASSYYVDNGYISPANFSQQLINAYSHPMFLKQHFDPNSYYVSTAAQIGIREGSTIVGEQCIRFKEYLEDKLSKQPLFYTYSNIDTHSVEHAFESDDFIEWCIVAQLKMANISIPVPLGAMLPKGVDRIIAAGRCMDFDHEALPCTRMKKDMQKSGEAAATAVFLAINQEVGLRHISYNELSKMLEKTNCLNHSNNKLTFRVDEKPNGEKIDVPIKWHTSEAEIFEQMQYGVFGAGVWSAKRLGDVIIPALKTKLNSQNHRLQTGCAYALALLGDNSGVEVIRGQLGNENHYFKLSAIYLLGKLKDEHSIEALMDIAEKTANDIDNVQNAIYALLALNKIAPKSHNIRSFSESLLKRNRFEVYLNKRQNITYFVDEKLKKMLNIL